MEGKKFILGQGERLVEDLYLPPSGRSKEDVYTLSESQARLSPMLRDTIEEMRSLPGDACPNDEAVALFTLNPEYIARSYFPAKLFTRLDFTVLGSRAQLVTPQKPSKKSKSELETSQLYVKGKRAAFQKFSGKFPDWDNRHPCAKDIIKIEKISFPAQEEKIKGEFPKSGDATLEVVLHTAHDPSEDFIIPYFRKHLENCAINDSLSDKFSVKGLCFLALDAPVEMLNEIASFTRIRVIRPLYGLQDITAPTDLSFSGKSHHSVELPLAPPVSKNVKVAVLDGGLPDNHPFENGQEKLNCLNLEILCPRDYPMGLQLHPHFYLAI